MSKKTTKKRSTLDPTFKQLLTAFLSPLPLDVQTEVEVSRLPRKIDAIVTISAQNTQQQIHSQTPFAHFKTHNQIEFKGKEDRLTRWDYRRILGRSYFYMAEQKMPFEEMTITIVSAGKPRKVLAHNQPPHIFKALGNGYYKNEGHPATYILVINELALIPKNYPLLIFASNKDTFQQALKQILDDKAYTYIRYAYEVRPQMTKEMLTMAGVTHLPKENLEFIAQDIGEELVAFLSPELRLRDITAEEMAARMTFEERLAGVPPEERLEGMTFKEQRKLLRLLLERELTVTSSDN